MEKLGRESHSTATLPTIRFTDHFVLSCFAYQYDVGCIACGSTKLHAGVKLRPKDMRDYYASMVDTTDVRMLKELMHCMKRADHAEFQWNFRYVDQRTELA